MRNKKGFTLMEMLIVIAIIAILITVAIPVFTNSMEKAARAVDMANARAIKAAISTMVMTGDISFPTTPTKPNEAIGIYIVVCSKDGYPGGYAAGSPLRIGNSLVFCGANSGISIKGEVSTAWNAKNQQLQKVVTDCFSEHGMKSFSNINRTVNGIKGWDWYIVEFVWNVDTQSGDTYIFSGEKGKESDVLKINYQTNIQKAMGLPAFSFPN